MSKESEKKGIEASFKSMDTEEFLDIYFNRPIGYAWALLFKKLKVHPNVVTIFSIILGIGAGECWSRSRRPFWCSRCIRRNTRYTIAPRHGRRQKQ